jgi:hypothetical protein
VLFISEFFKQHYNQGKMPRLHFWRDKMGHEVDCLIMQADKQVPIEIKAARPRQANILMD